MLGTRSISTAGKATPGVSARLRSRWVRQGLVGITDSLPAGDEEWYSRASSGRIFMNTDLPAIIIPCSLIQQVAGIRLTCFSRAFPLAPLRRYHAILDVSNGKHTSERAYRRKGRHVLKYV